MDQIYKLSMKAGITESVLLLDGPSRAGKSLVGALASNLVNVDYGHMAVYLDHIPILWRLGVLDDQSAVSFLRLSGDYTVFDRMIGRFANDRPFDIWTTYKSLNFAEEVKRRYETTPESRDGSSMSLVDAFNASGRLQSYVVHENLPHFNLWYRAFPQVRFLSTIRHPVDLVGSWNRRRWGERWGGDPLGFVPVPETPFGPVPWFAVEMAERYEASTPLEREVIGVSQLVKMYEDARQALLPKFTENIKFVALEVFAEDPIGELQSIADWLGTEMHQNMHIALAREGVPRPTDLDLRKRLVDQFEKEVAKDLFDDLMGLGKSYEQTWMVR